jgi:oxygen-independent coproporphyrinogen-3 oxidase
MPTRSLRALLFSRAVFASGAASAPARRRTCVGRCRRGVSATRVASASARDGDDVVAAATSEKTMFESSSRSVAPRSAYVHLPFCRSRCFYCDFAISVVGGRGSESPSVREGMERYARAVEREARETAARARRNASSSTDASTATTPLETVFFGGGTPSLVPADVLGSILRVLREEFGFARDVEISAEMDPGTFDEDKLRAFLDLGVNRVSLGVQSFDGSVLRAAGRSHGVEDVEAAIELMRKCRVPSWSVDLISGLPGADADSWTRSLRRAIDSGAHHVSVYDLQVEQGTAFYRWYGEDDGGRSETPANGRQPLPDEDASVSMFREASATLRDAGYEHYEVSSYAKPGSRCKHNQIYWENGSWYGFGMSATSHVNGERVARPRKMDEYYAYVDALTGSDASASTASGAVVTGGDGSDALFEHIMLRLRTSDGLNFNAMESRFGRVVVDEIREAAAAFSPEYATDDGKTLRLTDPEGFLMSTEILSTLIAKMPSLADEDGE